MDVTIEKEYEHEADAPFTDSLSGLFNHGFFLVSLEREVRMAERYSTPFTLALIDVDNLAKYNREHGAAKGDRRLKVIGSIVKKNIRDTDIAARYFDDTFAIIFAKSDDQAIWSVAERIRESVKNDSNGDATVSIGLASFPLDAKSKDMLIKKAENALFQAKLRGKNRTYRFDKNKSATVSSKKPQVLVVDNELQNQKLLKRLLTSQGYDVTTTSSGPNALYIMEKVDIDIVLLDVMMPEMDGYEICRRIKQNELWRLIPVVLVTAMEGTDAKLEGINAGADDFLTKPFNRTELLARTKSLINVKRLNHNLISIENVLLSLANLVEAKDSYTEGHIQRVGTLSVDLGKKMGLQPDDIEALRLGGILHDIGKIGVASEILNKPGRLTSEEFEVMKSHSSIGYTICMPLKSTIGSALEVIRHHHEKLDGSGYPDGLRGDEISMPTRIMAVTDIYDALTTDRPYRKGMPREKAISILRDEAGQGKLDKTVVEQLVDLLHV
ncbi:MAG: HD domain-containing phosphohydrolase [Pseudomonadota bacterium]